MSSSDRNPSGRPEDGERGDVSTEERQNTPPVRSFRSVNLTPKRIQANAEETRLNDEEFSERILFLEETDGGVTIAVEGGGEGKVGGSLAELDADQARLLGDALHLAADQIGEADGPAGGANE